MRAHDELSEFAAEHEVVDLWPQSQFFLGDRHRAPHSARNKVGRTPRGNIGLVWPSSSLTSNQKYDEHFFLQGAFEDSERTRAEEARVRLIP